MKTTPGLMPATKANIDKCIRELDRIKGGPGSKDRPDGLLRGNTNLHPETDSGRPTGRLGSRTNTGSVRMWHARQVL